MFSTEILWPYSLFKVSLHCIVEGDASNLRLTKVRFRTLSSHFFANYMTIFHITEVQMIILRCWTGLYLNWFKSYETKHKYFLFRFFFNFVKNLLLTRLANRQTSLFSFSQFCPLWSSWPCKIYAGMFWCTCYSPRIPPQRWCVFPEASYENIELLLLRKT